MAFCYIDLLSIKHIFYFSVDILYIGNLNTQYSADAIDVIVLPDPI